MSTTHATQSDQASRVAAWVLNPPPPRPCFLVPSVTTPLYTRSISLSSRKPLGARFWFRRVKHLCSVAASLGTADERTRTASLPQLRVIGLRCRGLHGLAKPTYLKGFLFSGLHRVAPYCAPGGIRVVSSRCESGTRGCPVSQTPSGPILHSYSPGLRTQTSRAGAL
jgi:hypothetical protein